MTHPKRWLPAVVLAIALQAPLVLSARAQTTAVDTALLRQLQEVIEQQQRQIERQSEQLKSQSDVLNALQKQMNDLKQAATAAQTEATEAKNTAQQAVVTATGGGSGAQASTGDQKLVTSGQERVKLAISGQVNRAINIADDGDKTKAYFVDNDASNSRFRLVGTGKVTDDFTIGTRFEFAFTTNESAEVSQDNEDAGEFLDVRWAEASFDSKRFGKLSLGQGDTASNNTSEVDLSKTDVVQYSNIGAIAGGLQFRDKDGNLTGVTVLDAFNNLDGLSRRDRVRYDTPTFYGFNLAASAVSDQRWDAALFWGGQGFGLKAAAAFAVVDPNRDDSDLQYNGSASILHESTGLNFTVSGGLRDKEVGDSSTNLWGKIGWITRPLSIGDTAFGIDYTRSNNFPTENDDGHSFGAAVVQKFDDFGAEFYAQYRLYTLDRDSAAGVDDINVGTIGTRVKF